MDWLQKIGGRKFIIALFATGIATFIELKHPTGLSATMAGFLGSIVAAFSVANYAVTKKHMDSKGGGPDREVAEKLDQILIATQVANNPETINQLQSYLQGINNSLALVQSTTGQLAQGVISIGQEVQSMNKRLPRG